MPINNVKNIAIVATCAALALGGTLIASSAMASPIVLADILDKDPLGYECVQSSYLEEDDSGVAAIAFSLSGKTRLPRTCLPEPCARALTPEELSRLTGTEMILARFHNEWDDYYARYADFCRKEVTAFATPTENVPVVPEEFWPPILERSRPPVPSSIITTRKFPPPGKPPPPFFPPRNPPPGDSDEGDDGKPKSIFMMTSAGGESGTPPTIPPAPVPVPPSGLLFGALLAYGVIRKTL